MYHTRRGSVGPAFRSAAGSAENFFWRNVETASGGARNVKKAGESDDRLFAVSAWRETPYFSEPERAALALTETVTHA